MKTMMKRFHVQERCPIFTTDAMLAPPTKAELEENQRRTAAMSGVDLGRLWIGDVVAKTKSGVIKDRAILDEALATLTTGLAAYYGGELGNSKAEGGPASALAFTTRPSADPEGARSDVPENIRRGEQMKEALRDLWDKPRSNALPTDSQRDAETENQQPWRSTGEPHELGLTIGDGRSSRRTVADGVLHDIPRNRSIGDEMNSRHRKMHGQPELLHGQ